MVLPIRGESFQCVFVLVLVLVLVIVIGGSFSLLAFMPVVPGAKKTNQQRSGTRRRQLFLYREIAFTIGIPLSGNLRP